MQINIVLLVFGIIFFGAIGVLASWAFSQWPGLATWKVPLGVIVALLFFVWLFSVLGFGALTVPVEVD